jgi:hypothetical protein
MNTQELLKNLRKECFTYDFNSGQKSDTPYTLAKVIDMIGFGYSFNK